MAFRRRHSGPEQFFDPRVVDLVATSPDASTVRLYIVATFRWTGSDAQVMSLQEKIHTYVGFALDGQMEATYPHTKGLPWEIVVECQTGPPDDQSRFALEQVAERIRRYGGILTFPT